MRIVSVLEVWICVVGIVGLGGVGKGPGGGGDGFRLVGLEELGMGWYVVAASKKGYSK